MRTMRRRPRLTALVLAGALAGCATARNYAGPDGPRFAGQFAGQVAERPRARPIRVVSFNIKYGRNVTGAWGYRWADYQFWTSSEASDLLAKNGIKLMTYREFGR